MGVSALAPRAGVLGKQEVASGGDGPARAPASHSASKRAQRILTGKQRTRPACVGYFLTESRSTAQPRHAPPCAITRHPAWLNVGPLCGSLALGRGAWVCLPWHEARQRGPGRVQCGGPPEVAEDGLGRHRPDTKENKARICGPCPRRPGWRFWIYITLKTGHTVPTGYGEDTSPCTGPFSGQRPTARASPHQLRGDSRVLGVPVLLAPAPQPGPSVRGRAEGAAGYGETT